MSLFIAGQISPVHSWLVLDRTYQSWYFDHSRYSNLVFLFCALFASNSLIYRLKKANYWGYPMYHSCFPNFARCPFLFFLPNYLRFMKEEEKTPFIERTAYQISCLSAKWGPWRRALIIGTRLRKFKTTLLYFVYVREFLCTCLPPLSSPTLSRG